MKHYYQISKGHCEVKSDVPIMNYEVAQIIRSAMRNSYAEDGVVMRSFPMDEAKVADGIIYDAFTDALNCFRTTTAFMGSYWLVNYYVLEDAEGNSEDEEDWGVYPIRWTEV